MYRRGLLGYLPANITSGIVGLLTIVVFTRLLTPEQYGAYALADGILSLGSALAGGGDNRSIPTGWLVVMGLLGIAAGLAAFLWPGLTAFALVLLIGAWAVTIGILEIIGAIWLRHELEDEWLLIAAGILSVLFGTALLLKPGAGALALAWAIGAFAVLMFAIGLPIAYYAAKYGVDIDLLTRGAGFGYMGSTVTSLIYASFTFLLFAIEASIMSVALNLVFDIPMWLAHICSSLLVIPIALYGISLISRMQIVTQPIWLVLQFVPIAVIAWNHPQEIQAWTGFGGTAGNGGAFDFMMFGLAASVLLSLLPQIGEQVDYLRFLPNRTT